MRSTWFGVLTLTLVTLARAQMGMGPEEEEMMEAMGIATLVGGTIVIPHLRRAYEFWEVLEEQVNDEPTK